MSAEGRFSAILLSILPVVLFFILKSVSPGYYGDIANNPIVRPVFARRSRVDAYRYLYNVSNGQDQSVMTSLTLQISDLLEGGSVEIFATMFFTFLGAFLFVLAYMDILRRREDIKRRAVLERNMSARADIVDEDWLNNARSLRFQKLSLTSSLLGDVERRAKDKETEASKIKRDLLKAGFFGENASLWYQAARLGMAVAFALATALVANIYFPLLTSGTKIFSITAAAVAGFLLPSRFIALRHKQIVEECRNGFPDFVDLMVICAEAGLSPRAAIDRLSREIAAAHQYLGANLYLANLEIRAGNSLHEALFNLGRRTEVEEAVTLATLLQQTEQLGTNITNSLRIYSEEMRDRRLMRAEERANSLPVKLVLPLGLFVFPVILVVVLLPIMIRMKNALLS